MIDQRHPAGILGCPGPDGVAAARRGRAGGDPVFHTGVEGWMRARLEREQHRVEYARTRQVERPCFTDDAARTAFAVGGVVGLELDINARLAAILVVAPQPQPEAVERVIRGRLEPGCHALAAGDVEPGNAEGPTEWILRLEHYVGMRGGQAEAKDDC